MRLLIVGLIIASFPGQALAISSFRMMKLTPTKKGAVLHLAYTNTWGDPAKTEAERKVRLFVHTVSPRPGVETGATVKAIGEVDMPGDGSVEVKLDYAKLGLKAGQSIWLHGRWVKSNHGWGEPWKKHGRSAGTLSLPAQQNSSLNRASRLRAYGGRLVAPRTWRLRQAVPLRPAFRPRSAPRPRFRSRLR